MPDGNSDLFPTPKPTHRRYSDPCLFNTARKEFQKACKVWDADGVMLPMTLMCRSAGTQWCGDALVMIQSNSQRFIDMVLVFAPAMSHEQFMKFHQQSAKAKKTSQGQTQVVWFYHEDDGLCPVQVGSRTTFSVDHIDFQNVKLPGWSTINKSLYGCRCHNLPGVLMSTDLIKKNFWMQRQMWQPIQEYSMHEVLPSNGGIAFVLF